MEKHQDGNWLERFRRIIIAYNENRAPDPFMIWFRRKDAEGFFADDFERCLTILIDARFDQRTTAENALQNTITVVDLGTLKRLVMRNELPSLTPRQNVTAERWTELFCESLPKLHELSAQIVTQREWDAAELLDFMRHEFRVPYLGTKTSRLAVRWLHELVPGIRIDMLTYKIPIDSLVYRVVCRLGIINPYTDKYSDEDSSADVKIQRFVSEVSQDKPWLLDEPLWSTGRQPDKGGHCFPTHPDCRGCIFESVCQREFTDIDPAKVGMETTVQEDSIPKQFKRLNVVTFDAATKEKQRQFAKFVDELKQKGIRGEEYREKIMQWQREH